jgi:hypothetical protein
MKFLRVPLCILILALTAAANYQFVRYSARFGWQPIYEKFDLNALPNKTVPFFIVPDGLQATSGDNNAALFSQILLAAKTWNDVQTSELRVAFGGFASNPSNLAPSLQGAPGIDVVFEEVPPGVISMAGPTVRADANLNSDQPFTPIRRSQVIFRRDVFGYKSFSEEFFLNAVHEFGHALGLQHTFASSAMSTQSTRATTKARPLGSDDIAGISVLYPSKNFQTMFGSVSGRVTLDGNGVNLASVVVLSLNGTSVSTLTHPDGSYKVQGVPAGPYLVYAHPLPPAVGGQLTPGDVIYPRDNNNNPIPVGQAFDLQFFPGTRDLQGASTIQVGQGQSLENINFAVNKRDRVTLFGAETFSYFGNNPVKPAFLNPSVTTPLFVATGYGFVTADSKPIDGLRAAILGGSPAVNGLRGFSRQFIIFDLILAGNFSEGERHLMLDNGSETYILPSAVQVATRRSPDVVNINWAGTENGVRLAQLNGSSFQPQSRVLIDGVEATVRSVDPSGSSITIVPPPAPTGHVGRVAVLNSDGQSSLFLKPDALQLPYTDGETAGFTLSNNVLTPGTETVIEVNAPGARFQRGRVGLGFGTSDVQVRSLAVVSPTRLLASVSVAPQAAQGALTVTLNSGLHLQQQRNGAIVGGAGIAASRNIQIDSNWSTEDGSRIVQAGSNAVVGINLTAATLRVAATLNDLPVAVASAGNGRVNLSVPGGMESGFALLRLTIEGEGSASALVMVSGAAPSVQRVESAEQFVVDGSRPATPGEMVTISFTEPSLSGDAVLRANEVSVSIGGVEHQTLRVLRVGDNLFQTTITLSRSLANGTLPMALTVNGRSSGVSQLPVRNR